MLVFSAKCWDCRDEESQMESATPCYDAQMVQLYLVSSPVPLTGQAVQSKDWTIS